MCYFFRSPVKGQLWVRGESTQVLLSPATGTQTHTQSPLSEFEVILLYAYGLLKEKSLTKMALLLPGKYNTSNIIITDLCYL